MTETGLEWAAANHARVSGQYFDTPSLCRIVPRRAP